MTPVALIRLAAVLWTVIAPCQSSTPADQAVPQPLSTDPPCPAGERWSVRASQCCPVCPPGTEATGACAVSTTSASGSGGNSNDKDSSSSNDAASSLTLTTAVSSRGGSDKRNNNNNSIAEAKPALVNGCRPCIQGLTYSSSSSLSSSLPSSSSGSPASSSSSSSGSHEQACVPCTSRCPKNARLVSPCNATHDAVCECEAGLYYLSPRSGHCQLCDLCPAGWGVGTVCGAGSNTACSKCHNGTFSHVLSATAPCLACTTCLQGQRVARECTGTQDTRCEYRDIPPIYRFNGNNQHRTDVDLRGGRLHEDTERRQKRPAVNDDDDGIDVIPLYCAGLGAVVVGLLAYVAFVHYRRMRDKRMSREPHEDVEYSKASGADSGVFVDPEHHLHHHHQQQKYYCAVITGGTRLKDLPAGKKKELEKTYLAGSRSPNDWKGLARELGYNSGKISSFEARGGRDPGAPFRHVLHDWGRLEGATVAAFLRALRSSGRHDVVKFLQSECAEQLQPLTASLPQHVV